MRTAVGLSIAALLTAAGFYAFPRIVEMFGGRLADVMLQEASIDEEVVEVLETVGPAQPPVGGDDGEPAAEGDPRSPPAAMPATTFLVIGSDSREDLPAGLVNDRTPGQRADVIMLITLEGEQVRVLSIPRDLQVEIEGYGTNKVNAAFAFGGSSLMVSAVSQEFDIPVNHYLEVDFFGFASIVDELGGVDISFPYRARDRKSFLDVPAGTETLDGEQALAYARSRNYQELRGSGWVTVDGSDLGRIRRQQTLLFAMLASLRRPTIIFDALDVVRAAGRHLTLDAPWTGSGFWIWPTPPAAWTGRTCRYIPCRWRLSPPAGCSICGGRNRRRAGCWPPFWDSPRSRRRRSGSRLRCGF